MDSGGFVGVSIWQKCLYVLEDELTSKQYNTWIRPLQVISSDSDITLLAPNKYIKDKVSSQFLQRIKELIAENGCASLNLEIGSKNKARQATDEFYPSSGQKKPGLNSLTTRENFYPLLGLNKSFTFDTFVEGSSNEMARAAAVQVSENVGGASYNPLLLYGGSGLGKTHLMHAVGNSIVERHPNLKVAYMYSQRFMEDMVRAIERGTMSDFTQYYRSVDVDRKSGV